LYKRARAQVFHLEEYGRPSGKGAQSGATSFERIGNAPKKIAG
jgi:hypothetical protein